MHSRSTTTVTSMMGGGGFMPHAYCYLWNPALMLLHAVSDSLIALAYFSVPALLVYFVKKRSDTPLRPIAMFVVFIVGCGLTHALSVWTLWHADYWFAGAVKAVTAAASLATVVTLVPLIPKVLKFRSASGLERKNFELETRYQRLMETAHEGIWTVDLDGRVTFVNQKLTEMLGYETGELIGRYAFDFVLASEREESRERFQSDRLTNRAQDDRRFVNKNGATVYTICSSNPIYDKHGACTGVLAMYADVTERRRAENELLRSEDRNRSVAEALPQMVWAATATGDMFYYSARWSEYTGAPLDDLLGWGWQPFLHPDDLADCLDRWNDARSHGIPFEAENRLRRADGTYRWHLSRALPIRDETGAIVQWFGAATDINDQKLALEAQRRLSDQLQYVVEATDRLSNSLESQEALQTLCDLIVPRFADWIAVNMVEDDGTIRNVALAHADPGKAAAAAILRGSDYVDSAARGVIAEIIDTQMPILSNAYSATYPDMSVMRPQYRAAIAELGLDSIISVPLLVRGRAIGVMSAVWSQSARRYSEAEIPFFQELAKRAAAAFDEADRHNLAYVNQEITRRIMQSSGDCIAVLTLGGRLMTLNEPGARKFGASGTTLEPGSQWEACWRPEDQFVVSESLAAARGGTLATYQGCLKSTGDAQWWDVVVTPIAGAIGVTTQLLAVARDITRQKDHESSLEALATRYRAFANAIPALAFTATFDGTVDFVNERWIEYTGLSPERSIREGLRSVLHDHEREQLWQGWTTALRLGVPHEAELRLRRAADGEYRWHLMRALPVRDAAGNVVQWFGTGTDIDDQKRAEAAIAEARDAALNAAKIKSQFVATMSHEIRTPISGVIGMTELLLITTLSDEQREYANVVRDSGQSLLRVVNDILDYSKLDAGKLQLEVIQFDVGNQIKSVTDLLGSQIEAKSIRVTSTIDERVPPSLSGDPERVRQILVNLIGNAVKFTSVGGRVEVHAGCVADFENTVRVRFEVRDDGVGIAPDVQPRLFEAFSQGDGSTTRKYGGTGLGLSICKQLVALMDGTIGVESVLGEGSTFWFEIAFGRVRTGRIAPQASLRVPIERRNLASTRSHRILLVEDNEINTLLAQRQFEQLGFRIATAANGREALEAVRTRPFDLVFMDCHMPEMDGFEATRELRRLEHGGPDHLRIIAMTADAQTEDHTACLAAGMDDYLSKPSSLAQLHAMLDRWLPEAPRTE